MVAPLNPGPLARAPLLILAFVALLSGALAGLARLGWLVPNWFAGLSVAHGPLMLCGFFGTVIALERAVALGRAWAYLGPLAAALGNLALLVGLLPLSMWLMVLAAAVLTVASLDVVRRQLALYMWTLALGAAAWLLGNLVWTVTGSVPLALPWWMGFLVLTIAGERLELSRMRAPSKAAVRAFGLIVAVLLLAFAFASTAQAWAIRVMGLGLLALAAWLVSEDVARRTVRGKALSRFIAVCLLSGYVWLAVSGAVLAWSGSLLPGSPGYDAALHALLLGFVFAMVFGHAPIILPAVLQIRIPYHPFFYASLVVLHASLLLRLGGDALGLHEWRSLGGMGNLLALLLFIANTVTAALRGRKPIGAPAAARGTASRQSRPPAA